MRVSDLHCLDHSNYFGYRTFGHAHLHGQGIYYDHGRDSADILQIRFKFSLSRAGVRTDDLLDLHSAETVFTIDPGQRKNTIGGLAWNRLWRGYDNAGEEFPTYADLLEENKGYGEKLPTHSNLSIFQIRLALSGPWFSWDDIRFIDFQVGDDIPANDCTLGCDIFKYGMIGRRDTFTYFFPIEKTRRQVACSNRGNKCPVQCQNWRT